MNEDGDEPKLPGLGQPELKELLRAGRVLDVPPHSMLCEEGQLLSRCFVVAQGAVEVAKTVGGTYHPLSKHGPGSVLALMAALDGGPCRVSMRAADAAKVIEIGRENLLAMFSVNDNPASALAYKLTTMAVRRLRQATDDLAQAIHRSLVASGRPGHIAIPDLAMIHARDHAWKPEA
jgi:CRP-like cAMP-binding protein